MTFLALSEIAPKEIMPGFRGRFIHSDAMTVGHWEIDAGSELPTHSHPQEMIINFMEGQFELTVDGETRPLTPGDVILVPGDVLHSGRAITDCRIIDIWHPPRDDYR
jgi:quercetin dioxygenase-like cupin family protein